MQLRQLSFLSSIALSIALLSSSWGIATRAENRDRSSPETLFDRPLKPSTSKSAATKPAEFSIAQTSTEANPEESEPAEPNSEESIPADDEPAEANPTEANPEESIPADNEPAEANPTEANPEDSTPINSAILLQENGKLEDGDATFDSDGSFYDTYTFVGRAGQSISIDVKSEEFDTYLLLVDSEGNTVGENDDVADGNTNSRLEVELESNSIYTIVVNGFDSEHKGVYSLMAITQLGTGDLQATLSWNTSDDLDLTILDPNEELVSFETPSVNSGGKLDVDANALCESTTTTPVENIFWPPSKAPKGSYAIAISLYTRCPASQTPTEGQATEPIEFTLTLTVQGTTETFTGTVDESNNFVTFPTAVY
ncbi:pre-peptidase C-terminal domain-containing protein [Oscillatoriales cyanobacterium LEGE 11467]|uniref:Pre-peptidase C-terminal domain-containing protein n=1 Tax=Zarconia navalis LEGE 11467 TaxID=1828826 RepID=A0A928W1A0_9CYAN|nr:pre-peptidase C-terminal domain-containing protein [Zarconia navalis]MBE9041430.1 pre-peptidase C-terminal domain-containing protein [Zarconia navalis LEGE 11467]